MRCRPRLGDRDAEPDEFVPRPGTEADFGARLSDYLRDYLGMPPDFAADYVNTGMLVIDAVQWRSGQWEARLEAFCRSKPQGLLYADQCAVNVMAWGRIRHVATPWNRLYLDDFTADTPEGHAAQHADPWIIHYAGVKKPWTDAFTQDARLYWEARDRSPFAAQGGYMEALGHSMKRRLEAHQRAVEASIAAQIRAAEAPTATLGRRLYDQLVAYPGRAFSRLLGR